MNKLAIAIATPAVFIVIDWAIHENEAGYNIGLARALSMGLILLAFGIFLIGQYDAWKKYEKEKEARGEAIRAMLQKSIDENLRKGN